MKRTIKSFGINNSKAYKFKEYLEENNIDYSMYPMENYWHFNCVMTDAEYSRAENYCNKLFNRKPKEVTAENNRIIIIEVTRYIIL